MKALLIVGLFLGLALSTRQHLHPWQNNLTLWTYAVSVAPLKTRPHADLAGALILAGRYAEARTVLDQTLLLAGQPTVPLWERNEALFVTQHNLLTLAVLTQSPK